MGQPVTKLYRGGFLKSSGEILHGIFQAIGGNKEAAYRLHLTPQMIMKWQEGEHGKRNPLDRTKDIVRMMVEADREDLFLAAIEYVAEPMTKAKGSRVTILQSEHLETLKELTK